MASSDNLYFPNGVAGVSSAPRTLKLVASLTVALAVLASISLLAGIGSAAFGDIIPLTEQSPEIARTILFEIRLPRTLLAIVVGASLGLAGATLQGLLRNPLATPEIVGASSGASLGAVLVFYFGVVGSNIIALPIGGMVGAVLTLFLVLALAGRHASMTSIILAGIAINTIGAALTSLALNLAPSPFAINEIVFWMLGSLTDRSVDHVIVALPPMLLGWGLMASTHRALDALSLGDETAQSLGFSIGRIKILAVLGAGVAVGAAVSVAGAIGFIGLVVPHILRPFVDHKPSALLLPSALGGAALLLAADIVVRLFSPGPELKLGVVTALVGAPIFIHIILSLNKRPEASHD